MPSRGKKNTGAVKAIKNINSIVENRSGVKERLVRLIIDPSAAFQAATPGTGD